MVAHTHTVCVSNTQIDNDIDIYIDKQFWKGVSDNNARVRNSENSCSFSNVYIHTCDGCLLLHFPVCSNAKFLDYGGKLMVGWGFPQVASNWVGAYLGWMVKLVKIPCWESVL